MLKFCPNKNDKLNKNLINFWVIKNQQKMRFLNFLLFQNLLYNNEYNYYWININSGINWYNYRLKKILMIKFFLKQSIWIKVIKKTE